MSKDNKKVAETPKVSTGDKAKAISKKYLVPFIDRVLQGVAVAFVLGTSFSFVQNWLEHNQVNHDYSLVGAILVMSVALYLIVRKR
jgi:hypothetical protein